MSQGISLKFKPEMSPNLSTVLPSCARTSHQNARLLLPIVSVWVKKDFAREISCDLVNGNWEVPFQVYFSRLFSVPKKNGNVRPILDLSLLNRLLVVPKFRMDHISKVVPCIREDLWGTTMDLEDAYFHVRIARKFQHFFAFTLWDEVLGKLRAFVFQVLPFGLSTAPWCFNRVTKPIKRHLRSQGILVLSFLDDFLNLASRLQISVNTNKTLALLGNLGFQVNWEKSCLIPSQRIVYLGVNLNLDDLTLSLPMDKVQQLLVYAHKVQESEFLSRRDLERLVGFLNFAADFLPLGRLYLKPIIHWLNQNTSAFIRDQPTLVDQALREALLPWLDIVALTSPIPMHLPEATIEIMTDASRYGWCGVLLPHQVHGIWEEEEKLQSMNWMELKTILLVLLEFADYCQGQCIRLFRQHDSLGLPKPSGFVSFCLPMVINQGDSGALPREGNSASPSSHRGASECAGRQGLEVFSDLNGMVFGQTLFSLGLQRTWFSSRGGSLCYKRDCTAAFFCLPLPRSIGRRPGLLYSGLEQVEHHLPFPSNPLFGQGGSEAVVFQRSRDTDSPPLAVSGLVPFAGSEVSEGVPAPFGSFSTSMDRQRSGILTADTVLEASRLDVVKNSLERQGYSKDSVRFILSRLKDSTDNRYQFVWTKFLDYLSENNINHNCISAKDVVNFLSYHASAFNKAYNTIGVYKCAIFTPLYYKYNINLRKNIRVSDFMQGLFALNPPPKKFNTPKWDISLVLNFLKSPQFEPLDEVPWKHCIMKTLFLLMLSSGRRISDIAALTREVFYLDECVQIVWVDGYRAKNHRQDFIPMDPLIMELDSEVSSELLLCPVRALNIYLHRSFFTRPDNDDMLWSVRQSTLSLYFKELINDAFKFNGNPAVDLPISTHQCRKFAASLSKFYIKSSDEDLAAWMGVKNINVLLKHYISRFPLVNVKCVVPLGTISPTT